MAAEATAVPPCFYHMGPGTFKVCREKLHSTHRAQLLSKMREAVPQERWGIALLQGGTPFHMYHTDMEPVFRQNDFFFYLFGVNEPDWYGAIDIRTGKTTLFMPRLPDAYAVWMGRLKTPTECKATYAVDEVLYVEELAAHLKQAGAPCLHLLKGSNTDSGLESPPANFEGATEFSSETGTLYDALVECRVYKTPAEIEIIRYCNKIGSEAHVAMMRGCRPGVTMEYQLESIFLHHSYMAGGCRFAFYTSIAASGPNGAILHYGHENAPNDRQVQSGDMLLLDMGCEYYHYGSDITCSWPATGRFTAQQRGIYEAVLDAQVQVKAAMRPGVPWPEMHELANRVILSHLLALGLVKGDLQQMMDIQLGALFMPHGLGHLLGLEVHDVGGYAPGTPPRILKPGYKSLRTARVLQPGMVITVEPGCYFNATLLLPALEDPATAPFLVKERILEHMQFGGVRIEDNVLITETGCESFTDVPRTVEEIEAVMAGAPWPSTQSA